jgi:hypothetical protein
MVMTRHMGELRDALLQLRLGSFACGDVEGNPHDADQHVLAIGKG